VGLKLGRMTRTVVASGWYFLAASLATIVLMLAGTAALYVTSAPAWLSLLIEPFSLVLLPGLVFALATSGSHDFAPEAVIAISAVFYVGLLYAVLLWRASRRRGAQPGVGGSR
jgi:hypothetical protein